MQRVTLDTQRNTAHTPITPPFPHTRSDLALRVLGRGIDGVTQVSNVTPTPVPCQRKTAVRQPDLATLPSVAARVKDDPTGCCILADSRASVQYPPFRAATASCGEHGLRTTVSHRCHDGHTDYLHLRVVDQEDSTPSQDSADAESESGTVGRSQYRPLRFLQSLPYGVNRRAG